MKYATPRYNRNSLAGAHFGGRSLNRFGLNRALLPDPKDYLTCQQIRFTGNGLWLDAICPFHDDHNASLRMNSQKGCFKCMACGTKGGDLIAFHQRLTGLGFIETCKALGAWEQQA